MRDRVFVADVVPHRVESRANLKSIAHRCHLFEVVFAWELTKEIMHLPPGCLQGGGGMYPRLQRQEVWRSMSVMIPGHMPGACVLHAYVPVFPSHVQPP